MEIKFPPVDSVITWMQVLAGNLVPRKGKVISHHEDGITVAWLSDDSVQEGPSVFLHARIFWMDK